MSSISRPRLAWLVAAFCAALTLFAPAAARAAELPIPDGSFELLCPAPGSSELVVCPVTDTLSCSDGGLTFPDSDGPGWGCSGDVEVAGLDPCLQPQLPSDGSFAACLSTNGLWGGVAVGDERSDLVSPPVSVSFLPRTIVVSFDYEYGTSEEIVPSVISNPSISVTLLTGMGPLPIVVSDTWGTTPSGLGLHRSGSPAFGSVSPGCPVLHQSGRISIVYSRTIPLNLSTSVMNLPIQVEFSVTDQGDPGGLTFLCVDNLRIRVSKR